jgi:hypothetical protein
MINSVFATKQTTLLTGEHEKAKSEINRRTSAFKELENKEAGRDEYLRKVRFEMLKKPKRQHPFCRASFIEPGNRKSLQSRIYAEIIVIKVLRCLNKELQTYFRRKFAYLDQMLFPLDIFDRPQKNSLFR